MKRTADASSLLLAASAAMVAALVLAGPRSGMAEMVCPDMSQFTKPMDLMMPLDGVLAWPVDMGKQSNAACAGNTTVAKPASQGGNATGSNVRPNDKAAKANDSSENMVAPNIDPRELVSSPSDDEQYDNDDTEEQYIALGGEPVQSARPSESATAEDEEENVDADEPVRAENTSVSAFVEDEEETVDADEPETQTPPAAAHGNSFASAAGEAISRVMSLWVTQSVGNLDNRLHYLCEKVHKYGF